MTNLSPLLHGLIEVKMSQLGHLHDALKRLNLFWIGGVFHSEVVLLPPQCRVTFFAVI